VQLTLSGVSIGWLPLFSAEECFSIVRPPVNGAHLRKGHPGAGSLNSEGKVCDVTCDVTLRCQPMQVGASG
jgi:hypothetical protein